MAVGNTDGAEERRELAVWVQVAGAKRDGAHAVADQVAGSRSDRGEPLGNIVGVADRGREQEQPCLARAEDDRFFPDDAPLRICDILPMTMSEWFRTPIS